MRSKYYIFGFVLCCLLLLGINVCAADDAAASIYAFDDATYTDTAPDETTTEYYFDEYGEPYVYDENGEKLYTYTAPDGTTVEYYLDEYGEPYVYDKNGEKLYTYTYPDGTTIEYYLNEHDVPYTYRDGEQVFVVITLDRYKVTDPEVLDALNGNGDLASLYNDGAKHNNGDMSYLFYGMILIALTGIFILIVSKKT
ncbi:MAG: hypothetical protein K2J95_01225 [Lachnospiraceae bacterium]|nr:hypothetical protein [Lachnospiraceae bacterium]